MTKKKFLFGFILATTALTGCAPTQMVSMNNGMTGGTMATVSHVELTEISMNDQSMVSGQRQTCLQSGAIGENRACASTALPAIASKTMSDEALENIVRRDNLGAFVSPYTSDGVLAEWVNVGTNANIGSTVGSGVGAAAGSMIAGQLLDSVPGASLLGGFFGSQVGKDTGRDAAIAAYGGWEAIRASSDMSFNSLSDMAIYLTQKYGQEPTYGDAIKVTLQLYPELQNALAAAY